MRATGQTMFNFTFRGIAYGAFEGESIAAALLRCGVVELRSSPVGGGARGAFCWMGICQECLVDIDGKRLEACRTPAREGQVVSVVDYG